VLPENFNKIDLRHTAYVVQDISVLNVLTNMRRSIKIHLEFDTGMNRQGFSASELKDIIPVIKDNDHIELDGVMSHFYDAANVDRTSVGQQVEAFDDIVGKIKKAGFKPPYIHLSKTSGITEPASKYANAIRPGSGIYGVNPLSEDHKNFKDLEKLEPVLNVTSRIVKIREIEPGEGVGYNHTFVASKKMTIAVVPFGYSEGVSEQLSNTGQFCFKGKPVPIVGKVSMNHTMVDVSDCKAKIWDEIEIISTDRNSPNSLRQLQKQHGIYQLVTLVKLSDDVRRVVVD
jgi:alanine racemase